MASEQHDDPTGVKEQSNGADEAGNPVGSGPNTGIYSGNFEAYRTVTDQDYESVLNTGLVVLDTNVLLNLYRYHKSTSDLLLSALRQLDDRLWIPNHVMNEFWRRRESVIESRSVEMTNTLNEINELGSKLEQCIRTWANRVGLSLTQTAEVTELIKPVTENVSSQIQRLTRDNTLEQLEDTATDPILAALETVLTNRIAVAPSDDDIREAKAEAKQRFADERPPGYKDAKKQDNPAGDYLVWRETLREARRRSCDVLFVTGDVKEDWWRIDRGQSKGPRPELVGEMRSFADARLFMLRPESFLKRAGEILGISVNDESVQDIQRVTVTQMFRWKTGDRQTYLRRAMAGFADSVIALSNADSNSAMGSYLRRYALQLSYFIPETEIDLELALTRVWEVLEAVENIPIFVSGEFRRPSPFEQQVRKAINRLREAAVQVWLDLQADNIMRTYPDHPEMAFVRGEMPPGVTGVAGKPIVWDSEGVGQVEFTAITNFNEDFTTTRVVPPAIPVRLEVPSDVR